MTPLDQRRFLFVTGKGGTGKTTFTAACALTLAARGRRTLVALTDAEERVSALLGGPPLGPEITELSPNIWGVKISAEAALREYGRMVIKSAIVYRAVFDSAVVRSFFAAVPGLHPWAVLGKAWFHATERTASGEHRFDVVLFDAPATGHGLDMLRVPKVITDAAPPGLLRRDAQRALAMFRDPSQTAVVVLTLPEDMPANEAIELSTALREELGLPVACVVVNQVLETIFSGDERRALAATALDGGDPGDEALEVARRRALDESTQVEALQKIGRGIPAPLATLPLLFEDPSHRAAVEPLVPHVARALGAAR